MFIFPQQISETFLSYRKIKDCYIKTPHPKNVLKKTVFSCQMTTLVNEKDSSQQLLYRFRFFS